MLIYNIIDIKVYWLWLNNLMHECAYFYDHIEISFNFFIIGHNLGFITLYELKLGLLMIYNTVLMVKCGSLMNVLYAFIVLF